MEYARDKLSVSKVTQHEELAVAPVRYESPLDRIQKRIREIISKLRFDSS